MRTALFALSLALLLAGCSTRRTPAPSPPAPPVIITPVPGQVMSPRLYVTSSSSSELFVLRAAELATQRARDPALKAQARIELAEHRGLSAQLSFAGRGLNLLPPRAMWNAHLARLAKLAAASDFDMLYRQQMIAEHRYQLKINRDYAQRGTSPTLRPVARNAAQLLARHLAVLAR